MVYRGRDIGGLGFCRCQGDHLFVKINAHHLSAGANPWGKAAEFCRSRNADIAKLAMQFAVANTHIATTIVGSADPENMRRNVAWLDEPIDAKLLEEVMAILAPIRDQGWIVGRPENN